MACIVLYFIVFYFIDQSQTATYVEARLAGERA
jgi:hypothetical protein